jgi:hypothetical protein
MPDNEKERVEPDEPGRPDHPKHPEHPEKPEKPKPRPVDPPPDIDKKKKYA